MKDSAKEQTTLKRRLLDLWNSNSSPHEIALGIAIGVFIGIAPFYGFHIIMACIVAFTMKRINKVAIFLGMNISLPPTIPFITWSGYIIGRKILGNISPSLGWEEFRHLSFDVFIHFFYELLIGSFVMGTALSVLFYLLILMILKRKRARILVAQNRGF